MKMNKSGEAAAEFQRILDERGQAPLSILSPLAYQGRALAAAAGGYKATARKLYQDFFALWTDADSDLPVMLQARREYEALK